MARRSIDDVGLPFGVLPPLRQPSVTRSEARAAAREAAARLDGLPLTRARRSFEGRSSNIDALPVARCVIYGRLAITTHTLEEDVRERTLEELRPGVYAAWSDPLERLGITIR